MEQQGDMEKEYSADASSQSLYEEDVDLRGGPSEIFPSQVQQTEVDHGIPQSTPSTQNVEGASDILLLLSSTKFQEMVMQAFFQSTAALLGPSPNLLLQAGQTSTAVTTLTTVQAPPPTTWNEASFHMSKARQIKKREMMRTSAGENSDSQEDFLLPENPTSEQRALRTRRLNRWRAMRARDLTNNRKAIKKLPYVIHVDSTSKPRGIHRHQWKAAVHGQCGRLDPSMDNINHHSKNVVDSIWHALEKEWEFEGYAHKAREMFEKSATKFMRNRKMQLKYKYQKNVDGPRPNDVSPTHWTKIVNMVKKSLKQQMPSSSKPCSGEGNTESNDNVTKLCLDFEMKKQEEEEADNFMKKSICEADKFDGKPESYQRAHIGGGELGSSKRTPNTFHLTGESLASEEEDVDAQIKSVRSQLQWLESSKKAEHAVEDNFTEVAIHVTEENGTMKSKQKQAMKENVAPLPVSEKDSKFWGTTTKTAELVLNGNGGWKHASWTGGHSAGAKNLIERQSNINRMEIECGEIICMAVVIQGKEEDIGKGVLMGLAGSKFSRKVIPKGWCSIKVKSCAPRRHSQACPFPASWKDQVKLKTPGDAEGRIILWPENLLHI